MFLNMKRWNVRIVLDNSARIVYYVTHPTTV
jgi:hypothetical protein